MSNLNNLIGHIPINKSGSAGNSLVTMMMNAPIASLLTPLNEFISAGRPRLAAYDAFNTSLMNIQELYDTDHWQGVIDGSLSQDDVRVNISIADALAIVSGISQVSDVLGTDATGGLRKITFTDETGSPVCLTYDPDDLTVIDQMTSSELVNDDWSFGFTKFTPVEHEFLITHVAGRDYVRLNPVLYQLTEQDGALKPSQSIHLGQLLASMIKSASLNGEMIEAASALAAGRSIQYFSGISAKLADAKFGARTFLLNISKSYASGGLKGAIYYIFSIIKGTDSLTDEDGRLSFTDNAALRPVEYIVGMITQIVTTLAMMISTILSIFFKAFTAIAQAIGTIAWSVIGSFRYDLHSTYCSLTTDDSDDGSVSILNACPFAIFRGELSTVPAWYMDYFLDGYPVIYVDVVGGIILIGPGSFDDSQGTQMTPTSVRWEFHPSSVPFNQSAVVSPAIEWPGVSAPLGGIETSWILSVIDYSGCVSDYEDALNHVSTSFANSDEGHLTELQDQQLFRNVCWYSAMFFTSLLYFDPEFQSAKQGRQHSLFCGFRRDRSRDLINFVCYYGSIMYYARPTTSAEPADWSELIRLCDEFNNKGAGTYTFSYRDMTHTWPDNWDDVPVLSMNVLSNAVANNSFFTYSRFFGTPRICPSSLKFAITMPKYNRKTFFWYVAAAIGTTILVAATAAAISIKVSRYVKQKKAANLARFNSAQTKYQDAVNGNMHVVNPETGETELVPFEVSSAEGRAYINSCFTDYRRTARNNNVWATLIGGSRYDVSTFWGEAETGDRESVLQNLRNSIIETADAAEVSDSVIDSGVSAIYQVITGENFSSN